MLASVSDCAPGEHGRHRPPVLVQQTPTCQTADKLRPECAATAALGKCYKNLRRARELCVRMLRLQGQTPIGQDEVDINCLWRKLLAYDVVLLMAALCWIECSNGPTHLWTDSDWVAKSLNKILKTQPWQPSDHEDHWCRIIQGPEAKESRNFKVTKVSAHTSLQNRATPLEKEQWRRNDAADSLAKQGAQAHAVPEDTVRVVKHQRALKTCSSCNSHPSC